MPEKLIKASLIRALYTMLESMVSTIPAGFVITPVMIQSLDWSFLYVIIAWLGTALFAGFCAFVRAMVAGIRGALPELENDTMDNEDFDDFEDEEVDDEDDDEQ